MQSKRFIIHAIYKEGTNVVKPVMANSIKEDILNTMVYDVDFRNHQNFVEMENMYFGAIINCRSCAPTILTIKSSCLAFDIESVKQILLRFPLSKKMRTISDVVTRFRNLVTE